jgi:hypothetical protein
MIVEKLDGDHNHRVPRKKLSRYSRSNLGQKP